MNNVCLQVNLEDPQRATSLRSFLRASESVGNEVHFLYFSKFQDLYSAKKGAHQEFARDVMQLVSGGQFKHLVYEFKTSSEDGFFAVLYMSTLKEKYLGIIKEAIKLIRQKHVQLVLVNTPLPDHCTGEWGTLLFLLRHLQKNVFYRFSCRF